MNAKADIEEVKDALASVVEQQRELRRRIEDSTVERDRLIRRADELGLSRSLIAELSGVTVGRVHQIVTRSSSGEHDASPAPTPPTAQHMQALARANQVRLARAELKRAIARGNVEVSSVVHEGPLESEDMTLAELLTSQRRWGKTKAGKLLAELSLPEGKRLGALSQAQRKLLGRALDEADLEARALETGQFA